MSNLLLQKIVLLRVTEVGKIILKQKRPLLLARSVDVFICNLGIQAKSQENFFFGSYHMDPDLIRLHTSLCTLTSHTWYCM